MGMVNLSKLHIRIHFKEDVKELDKCDCCDYTSSASGDVWNHKENVHHRKATKRYYCKVSHCDEKFKPFIELANHCLTYHGDRESRICCKQCNGIVLVSLIDQHHC